MGDEPDARADAMHEIGRRLQEIEARGDGRAAGGASLDGAVAEFAVRVQRLERELRELRGMLEGMGRRAS
jgi:hypothetical protein